MKQVIQLMQMDCGESVPFVFAPNISAAQVRELADALAAQVAADHPEGATA